MRTYSTFEEAYRQQPFSELVRLGISLAAAIRRRRRGDRSHPSGKTISAAARA
jgi:hypothetical protein